PPWQKSYPCPLSQFQISVPCPLSSLKRTLFPISVPSISEKGNSHWAIVKPSDTNALACSVMVSSSCMAIPKLLAKLKNCCESSSGKSEATPHTQARFGTQYVFKHLSATSFSSKRDVKIAAENWLSGQGHNF
ncbi:hypothetical protein AVEN_79144-1, partial [Araneus ventricosus]